MKNRTLIGAGLCLLALPLVAQDDEEDSKKGDGFAREEDTRVTLDVLINPAGLWTATPEQLEKHYGHAGLRWLSDRKDRALLRPNWLWIKKEKEAASQSGAATIEVDVKRQSFSLFGGRSGAEEVTFDFKDGRLAMISLSIWNKGDSEEINERDFLRKIEELSGSLSEKLKVRAQELGRDTRSASKAERIRWETPATLAQLEHAATKSRESGFQGEFIRLRLAPRTKAEVGSSASANVAKVGASDLLKNVRKEPNGDVFIAAVPMVDQGEKGYCALASTERVMRYYGIQCDQHDMAQAAQGDAWGTNPDELQDALHKLQGRFKIRVRDLIHWDIKDYIRFTEIYNREAKRLGARLCEEGYYWVSFQGLDKEALKAARCRGSALDRFRRAVTDHTGRGVPLLWGLELGIFPENGEEARQSGGGHMRLIIGYNEKTDELIFSDSWGAGHEMKRMDMKEAFTVTKGLYMVEPQAR